MNSLENHAVNHEEEKERLQWEGFPEEEGFVVYKSLEPFDACAATFSDVSYSASSAQNPSNVNVWRLSSRANVRINSRGEPQPTSRRHFTAQKSRQAECVIQVMHAAASLLLLVLVVVVLRRSFHEKRCRNIIKTDTKWCNFFNVPTAEF